MEFRKLTDEELKAMGLRNSTPSALGDLAKYYDLTNAYRGTVVCQSDYNDSTYDIHDAYLIVLDQDGNEIPPIKGKSKEARLYVSSKSYELFGGRSEIYDPPNDIVFNFKMPELYIKK